MQRNAEPMLSSARKHVYIRTAVIHTPKSDRDTFSGQSTATVFLEIVVDCWVCAPPVRHCTTATRCTSFETQSQGPNTHS
eukprot:3612406-Rhodomonas_salina.1